MKLIALLVALLFLNIKTYAEEAVWKVQSYKPSTSFMYQNFLEYAVKPINEDLKGRLVIELLPQEDEVRLASIHNSFVALKYGKIDGMFTTPIYWGKFDPVFSIVGDMVAAWPSNETFDLWLQKDGMTFLNNAYAKHGMISIGYTLRPHESLVSKTPIRGLDDLKGKVIRVPAGGMQKAYFEKIGAVPREVSVNRVKYAMAEGILDMADYNIVYINAIDGLYKIAKHTNYKGFHSAPVIDFVVSEEKWNKLTNEDKELIKKHLNSWKSQSMLDVRELTDDTVSSLKNSGVHFYRWSEEDLKEARQKAVSVWDEYSKKSMHARRTIESIKSYLKSKKFLDEDQ